MCLERSCASRANVRGRRRTGGVHRGSCCATPSACSRGRATFRGGCSGSTSCSTVRVAWASLTPSTGSLPIARSRAPSGSSTAPHVRARAPPPAIAQCTRHELRIAAIAPAVRTYTLIAHRSSSARARRRRRARRRSLSSPRSPSPAHAPPAASPTRAPRRLRHACDPGLSDRLGQ